MISVEKLIEFINQAPFTDKQKARLILLAKYANEEEKQKIVKLVQKNTKKLERTGKKMLLQDQLEQVQKKAQEIKKLFREKGEEIIKKSERKILLKIEHEIVSI